MASWSLSCYFTFTIVGMTDYRREKDMYETYTQHYANLEPISSDEFYYKKGVEFGEKSGIEKYKEVITNGLDEGIRCAMCTNPMANDLNCDGSCTLNDGMYKAVMKVIENHLGIDINKGPGKGEKMTNDEKSCDAPVNTDCISKSRLIRQILKIDDISISPNALNRILEKIQNQVPYNQVDFSELDEQVKEN